MMNTMFNFIGSERQIEWAKKIVSGPYDFLMYIATTAKEEIKAHGEVSTYCEEVKFYSEAAKRYEAEIKKLVSVFADGNVSFFHCSHLLKIPFFSCPTSGANRHQQVRVFRSP